MTTNPDIMRIGYVRASSAQNQREQVLALTSASVPGENIIIEPRNRRQGNLRGLAFMVSMARKGDVVIVSDLSLLGQSAHRLQCKGVTVEALDLKVSTRAM